MKKYKTVAGYLRRMEEKLYVARIEPGSDAERAHERQAINSLLPQIGITETILDSEEPRHGIDRLLQSVQGERRVKALKDCRKWLGRMKITGVRVSVIPQVKTAEGLVTYRVRGFKHDDHNLPINVLVDAPEFSGEAFELAKKIAGPDYCFTTSENCSVLIPNEIKNKLLSHEELCAVVPELDPHSRPRRAAS